MFILKTDRDNVYDGQSPTPYQLNTIHPAANQPLINGHLNIIEWSLSSPTTSQFQIESFNVAAAGGYFNIVKILNENKKEPYDDTTLECAAINGLEIKDIVSNQHWHIIDYLKEKKISFSTTGVFPIALKHGNLEMIKLANMGEPMSQAAIRDAIYNSALNGHLHLVEYFHNLPSYNKESVNEFPSPFDGAARNDHLHVVKFLQHRGYGHTPFGVRMACQTSSVEMVKYLYQNVEKSFPLRAMDDSARIGNIQLLCYLYENTTLKLLDATINKVAIKGHIQVVQYLLIHSKDPQSDQDTLKTSFEIGLQNGHLSFAHFLWNNFLNEETKNYYK
ncbi:hypothetical protein DFA_02091 [Cavenderia fasciculata]|uniref:Ankyrin repeat-containing protein n=1 Tax=Cavenderia fasciculata TaxID=261658 RepID=F4PYN8_CACFS|nr:uncharacterized protein DFA_02091 [Cavenderia fasciculata]EGG19304.1 hypothetical protein DFA_02091 [Cavenderia fasciculata]|eukprot:XP_004357575.1 hypothetical protein DFA_02091 [Cavenderia fasciculata]